MRVLVVGGANVVGSRPDGWWRDRALRLRVVGAGGSAVGPSWLTDRLH